MSDTQPSQPEPDVESAPSRSTGVRRVARPRGGSPAETPSDGAPADPPERAAPSAPPPLPPPSASPGAPQVTGRLAPTRVRVARAVDVDLESDRLAEEGRSRNRVTGWLYQREEVAHHAARPWYKVLCLTGVDYFSTLGYQPGIALLAAGLLSPVATLILVLFTVFAALPIYRRIATESPHGQGSIALLERLLPRWRGKLFVLVLLGFAATDFIITITLSAADATAHIVENPFVPEAIKHNQGADIGITLVLIAVLGGVFLKGFKEAIGVAVVLVIAYLTLNAVVVVRALAEVGTHPAVVGNWRAALVGEHGNPFVMLGLGLLLFPRLALGLSGFETGVAVMPLVKGDAGETEENPAGRIRNTKLLLTVAALVMSVYLLGSSVATTLLIPEQAYREGGEANGRALAFLAHQELGDVFGTVYDISTIAILWFAGASAMAAMLNLVPRYLPGYGMAPRWAAAQRPLVLILTAISFLVTLIFRADVEAQGGAYATGVLVLMLSGAIAVTISAVRRKSPSAWAFGLITLAFFYATAQNVHERPSGIIIASFFILGIVATSVISRVLRATELRFGHVVLDRMANQMITAAIRDGSLCLVTHDPLRGGTAEDYAREVFEARRRHRIAADVPVLVLEVHPGDPSVFADDLLVMGETVGAHRRLRCTGPAIANAITALAVAVHGRYGCGIDLYMRWTPIDSVVDAVGEGMEFLLWGGGDMARLVELEVRRERHDQEIIVHAA